MAYCKQCGAYIPDGQAVCLACGFDPDAEKKREAEAQATARAYQEAAAAREDELRAEVERRRAERQQNDRVWADNERRLRQMEEEFRRSQAEKEKRAESYVHRDNGRRVSVDIGNRRFTFGAEDTGADNAQETDRADEPQKNVSDRAGSRGIAALSYLGILCIVPLFFASQEDDFIKFHANQGLKLLMYTVAGSILGSFVGVGWVASLLGTILAIKGVLAALNGQKEQLPILKKLKWF